MLKWVVMAGVVLGSLALLLVARGRSARITASPAQEVAEPSYDRASPTPTPTRAFPAPAVERARPAPPRFAVEAPASPRGALPDDELENGMRAARPRLAACVHRFRMQSSEGLVLRFVLQGQDGAGRVANPTVVSAEQGRELELPPSARQCLLSALAAVSFPAPAGGGIDVSYPLALQ